MLLKEVINIYELLDDSNVDGQKVKDYLLSIKDAQIEVKTLEGDKGSTDFVRILIPGKMEDPKVEISQLLEFWED